ncbi:hypothetical protein IMZ48_06175 [Candidatus Bathyarchaeota archaeon]|nr:hypothetical protein [Candidatus Bathyarchaeota archaeon]
MAATSLSTASSSAGSASSARTPSRLSSKKNNNHSNYNQMSCLFCTSKPSISTLAAKTAAEKDNTMRGQLVRDHPDPELLISDFMATEFQEKPQKMISRGLHWENGHHVAYTPLPPLCSAPWRAQPAHDYVAEWGL